MDSFTAVVMSARTEPSDDAAPIRADVCELGRSFLVPESLPDGEVLVQVGYSGLNYKEAIIFSGQRGAALELPLIMGIDGVGVVAETAHPSWNVGDEVIINGAGMGDLRHGAIGEYALAPGDVLVRLPQGMTMATAGALGTAGLTAALSVDALVRGGVEPGQGPVLVTGASGGVGAITVMLLARAGYHVAALTGRAAENGGMLHRLGAATLIERADFTEQPRGLQDERWAGAVDTVGGPILANALAQTTYDGVVTCCGLAASREFTSTVMPFILRGVSLIGINSVDCPARRRESAWDRLARDVDVEVLASMTTEIEMSDVPDIVPQFLDGSITGRIRVRTISSG